VNDVYNEHGLLMFALEIVVNKSDGNAKQRDSGTILLNPGNYKLPKPFSKNNKYKYYGYLIAGDQQEALAVFEKDLEAEKDNKKVDLQTFD
jgi:hypothetical protein